MMTPSQLGPSSVDPSSQLLTFLIADVRGYSQFTIEYGDEAAAELAGRFAALADKTVSNREGKVLEQRGDEILAVFGSARQALRAAVDLQTRLQEHPLHPGPHPPAVGIGIDAGEAVPVDEGYRGAALNLAARLCTLAAPGEVLASGTVTSLARKVDGIQYLERPNARLKGFPDPVTLFQITASGGAGQGDRAVAASAQIRQALPTGGFLGSLPSGKIAGRQAELNQLRRLVPEVEAGSGRLVMLAGEPGAGKTRLAQELTSEIRDRGFLIAVGCCYETRGATAFYPFRDVLAMLYAAAGAGAQRQAAGRWPYLVGLVPDMPIATRTETAGAEDQERLFWSVSSFVDSLTDHPVAILLDDLHWSDASSLDLLQHLARRTRALPVLILGTYRDTEVNHRHPLEASLRELNRQELLIRIPVKPLDRSGTRSMVRSMLDRSNVSEDFVTLLHERTDGNPFFVTQVMNVLAQQGALTPTRLSKSAINRLEVPESIRSVTAQRLGRLDGETQEMLRVASVFGQRFGFDDLLSLSMLDTTAGSQNRLEAMLEAAAALRIVTAGAFDSYTFDHALTQETLYHDLTSRRRRRLHRAAAEVIEQSGAINLKGHATDLARHFLEGDAPERALPYLLMAADQSAAASARSETEAAYRRAIEVAVEVGSLPHLAEAGAKLGRVLSEMGKYDDAVTSFESALTVYGQIDDRGARLRVEVESALALLHGQKPDMALQRLHSTLDELTDGQEPATLAAAYAVQARIFMATARHADQLTASERAEKLARELGDDMILGGALVDKATALAELGEHDLSRPVMEDAIAIAERVGDDLTLWRALNNAGVLCGQDMGMTQSEAYHVRALEVAERSASPVHIAHARAVRGVYSWLRGEWIEASHWFEHAAVAARQLQASPASWVLTEPAWMHSLKGREEEATRELEACLARAQEFGDERLLLRARHRLALQDLIQSRPSKALATVEDLLPRQTRGEDRCDWLLLGAEAALDLRRAATAKQYLDELTTLPRQGPWSMVSLARLQGALHAEEAKLTDARSIFEDALTLARSIPFRMGEADVLRAWALAEDADGEAAAARSYLKQAHDIYRDLGARPMADAVKRELLAHNQHRAALSEPLHPAR